MWWNLGWFRSIFRSGAKTLVKPPTLGQPDCPRYYGMHEALIIDLRYCGIGHDIRLSPHTKPQYRVGEVLILYVEDRNHFVKCSRLSALLSPGNLLAIRHSAEVGWIVTNVYDARYQEHQDKPEILSLIRTALNYGEERHAV